MSKRSLAPKRKGELAELRFWTEATRRGMIVSKPYGDSARYDFVVDCAGQLSRVQVKSTSSGNQTGYHMNCCAGSRRPYRPDDVDFIAAYVVPNDTWYIVPVSALGERTSLTLSRPHSQRRPADRFKERWDLLENEAV